MEPKYFGTSGAAREAGCTEGLMRAAEKRGLIAPARDSAGRRLYTHDDIAKVRQYLGQRRNRAA